MATSNPLETTLSVSTFSTDNDVLDTRQPYQKKRALYFILASILFERIGFYALTSVLLITLSSNDLFFWDIYHSRNTLLIFSGK